MKGFFAQQGMVIQGVVHLSPKEALVAVERGALFVDLREDYLVVMKAFDLPGVLHLPYSQFKQAAGQLPKDQPMVFADAVGLYSKEAVIYLREHGYEEIASLNGGILAWEDAGLPTGVNKNELWSGSCMCQLRPRNR